MWLTHVEDQLTFDRYIEVISKIPTIDTDEARESMHEQLLKEARDYIEGCAEALRQRSSSGRALRPGRLLLGRSIPQLCTGT